MKMEETSPEYKEEEEEFDDTSIFRVSLWCWKKSVHLNMLGYIAKLSQKSQLKLQLLAEMVIKS